MLVKKHSSQLFLAILVITGMLFPVWSINIKLSTGATFSGELVSENTNFMVLLSEGSRINISKTMIASINNVPFDNTAPASGSQPTKQSTTATLQPQPTGQITSPQTGKSFHTGEMLTVKLSNGTVYQGTLVLATDNIFILDIEGSSIKIYKHLIATVNGVPFGAPAPAQVKPTALKTVAPATIKVDDFVEEDLEVEELSDEPAPAKKTIATTKSLQPTQGTSPIPTGSKAPIQSSTLAPKPAVANPVSPQATETTVPPAPIQPKPIVQAPVQRTLSSSELTKKTNELKSSSPAIRLSALVVIGEAGSNAATAAEPVCKLLGDTAVFIPSIQSANDPILNSILSTIPLAKQAQSTLVKIGKASIKPLLESLKDKREFVRSNAIATLGDLQNPETAKSLIIFLGDSSITISDQSTKALISINDAPSLIAALKDKDSDIRKASADILGQLNGEATISALIKALSDKDSYVREKCAIALGDLKASEAIPELIKLLSDNISFVRRQCAEALGNIEDTRVMEALIAAQNDESDIVRQTIKTSLKRLLKIEFRKYNDNAESLIEALQHPDESIRQRAANTLWLLTEQKLGVDYDAWKSWWSTHKDSIKPIR